MQRGVVGSIAVWLGSFLAMTSVASTTAGRMQSLCIVLIGLGLLGSAWIQLVGQANAEGGVALARRAALSWSLPLALAPPLFSRDAWSYAAQGYLTHLGLSPYVWTPSILEGPIKEHVDPMWMTTLAPYGPIPLLWGDLASAASANPWWLVFSYRLMAVAGLMLLMWAVPRLAAWSDVSPGRASALVLASPLTIAHGIGGAHNDLLMVGLAAVALVLGVQRNWVLGTVLAGVAAGVKLPAGLVSIGIVVATLPAGASLPRRLRRMVAAAAIAGGALVACGIPRGLGVGWLQSLGVPGVVHTPLSVTTMLGALVGEVSVVRGLGVMLALGVITWWALRRPTGAPEEAMRVTAAALVALIVMSPVVHLWYLLWVTPFVAAIKLTRWQSWALIVTSVVAGVAAPLDSSLHGLYLVVLAGAALAIAIAAGLLAANPHRDRIQEIARESARAD